MDKILQYQPWLLGVDQSPVNIVEGRRQGKGLVALLPRVPDREQAMKLVGQKISVKREQLPPVETDEYYWTDLEGLEVHTRDGVVLGRVDRLMETGANDVLVIRGEREHLVPFVQGQYVIRVDFAAGLMEVDWDPDF
jgi:16S rRNA processing protein RimM